MRTRTLLTTPPGRDPEPVAGTPGGGGPVEQYAPALARPGEPVPPSRLTRPVLVLATAVLIAAFVLLGLQLVTAGEQDPSVPEDTVPSPQALA